MSLCTCINELSRTSKICDEPCKMVIQTVDSCGAWTLVSWNCLMYIVFWNLLCWCALSSGLEPGILSRQEQLYDGQDKPVLDILREVIIL